MNFNELFQKMRELDRPIGEELKGGQKKLDVDKDGDIEADDLADLRAKKVDEEIVDECGMDMPMSMGTPKQQDNITMNISMNGSGAGGIRDLMDILKNIEQDGGDEGGDLGDLIGAMSDEPQGSDMHSKIAVIDGEMPVDEYANSPDETYAPMGRMTATGNDMHSKGDEYRKVNGGGNPMEQLLINKLSGLYEQIKNR
jgi:hypothetical protein